MAKLFTIGDETTHVSGDAKCPECLEAEWPTTRCDQCGRTEEELD